MNTQVNAQALLKLLRKRELPVFNTLPDVCHFVTKFLMKKYRLQRPSCINHGYCFIWAYLVWALWKKPVSFSSSDGHILVFDNETGFYFDSANCEGYECLEDADICTDECANLGIKGMAWYWARCGVYKVEFRKILRATHMKLYKTIARGGLKQYDLEDLYVDDIPYHAFV